MHAYTKKSKYLFPVTMAEHGGARRDISDFVQVFDSKCPRRTAGAEVVIVGNAKGEVGLVCSISTVGIRF